MTEYISKELVVGIIENLKNMDWSERKYKTKRDVALHALNEVWWRIQKTEGKKCIVLPYRITPNSVLYLKENGETGFVTFCDKTEADRFMEAELAN